MIKNLLQCSVVGKWTGGAVGAETRELIGTIRMPLKRSLP